VPATVPGPGPPAPIQRSHGALIRRAYLFCLKSIGPVRAVLPRDTASPVSARRRRTSLAATPPSAVRTALEGHRRAHSAQPKSVDPRHLLLIGAGPGVGASVVRRFGREGFRSTLISRGETLEQLAAELRSDGLDIEAVGADIEDLDGYRATLERIFRAPGAPGVAVYNAAQPDPGEILDTTVGRLRTAYDVDVLGAVRGRSAAYPDRGRQAEVRGTQS